MTESVRYGLVEMVVTYNEIKYWMPVLAGAVPEVAVVGFEVDFVEVEVTSVVAGSTGASEVLDDEAVVDLVVNPGTHWPEVVSGEESEGSEETYCTNCSPMYKHSLRHMR